MKTNTSKRLRVRVAVFVAVALLALAADRASKLWALGALGDGRTVVAVPHLLSLTLVRNPGASLGLGSSVTWLISCLALAACVAMALLALRAVRLWWTVALALAFSGAMGNLIDRVVYADGFLNGKVVDFLNYGWSVGNVADIILFVAAVMVVALIFAQVPLGRRDLEDASGSAGGRCGDNGDSGDADDADAADTTETDADADVAIGQDGKAAR
ncbi:signal peptidase II [Bifidobacterium sp. ESL0763]|uniref:signal peptidase II n=1 Tax=Bifidobacterium sp. ESL0763 TaxID=2983227 RepID=UPI0023F8DC98|nr:signal peptidase II [Bifidobacterium sp. ESL0763]MDF7664183.1 signal peptidase II [Bifidobacterium sp. ESL0763]